MSVFELDQAGWEKRLTDAQLSDFDANAALDASAGEGILSGAGQGIMRGAVKTWDTAMTLFGQSPAMSEQQERTKELANKMQDEQRTRALEFWTPSARDVGAIGNVLGGFAEIAAPLAVGAGNPSLLMANAAIQGGKDKINEGVDATTAATSGVIDAAATGIGFKLPFLGKGLTSKMATGAGGNLLLGAGTAELQRELLTGRGYEELAQNYDPLDAQSRAIDVLTGAAFGGLDYGLSRSQRHAVMAAGNAKHFQQDTAPGRPADVAASVAHQAAMEKSIQQLLDDEPVSVAETGVLDVGFTAKPFREVEIPEEIAALDQARTAEDVMVSARDQTLPTDRTSKEYLKRVVDQRPVPDTAWLPKDPAAYLNITESSRAIPLERIKLTKTDTAASGDNAVKRFAAAAMGEIPKRDPVALEIDENGTLRVVDGNGTVTAMQRMGVPRVIAEVRPSESLMKLVKTVDAPEPVRSKLLEAYDRAAKIKPAYDETVRDLAKEIGTPHEPQIPEALKAPKRAAEKVVSEYGGDVKQLRDLVRSTVVVDSIEQAAAAAAAATAKFGKPIKLRNTLEAAETRDGYRDINMAFEFRGMPVELQVNIPEMLEAKASMHKLYEERRTIEAKQSGTAADAARMEELDAQMREGYAAAWNLALSRMKASSETSVPSLRANPSDTGLPSGTSKAETENPPSGVGNAATGTPSTSQKMGSLPSTGNIANSSDAIVPQPGQKPLDNGKENAAGNQVVATATGRKIEVKPKLVELADLVTSDKPEFPQELQPRQRGARKALDNQVRDIANNLDPARLGDSAEADRGAPITAKGDIVESGNGRVLALRYVYENLPEKAAEYRDFLESQGYDLGAMKQPVLVRERVTDLSMQERRAFTVEANQAATAALSPVERAQADARLLEAGVLSQMRGGEIASAQNAGFVRAFMEQVPTGERNALMNPDGTISQEGVRRIQSALLAKAYGGKPESNVTLGRMLESTDSDMRSALGAMLDAAPAFARLRQGIADGKIAAEYDISGALTQAIENVAKLRLTGQSLRDFLAQGDMLTARPPIVDDLMKALFDKSGTRMAGREKIAGTLTKYAGQASKQRLDQSSLFAEQPVSVDEILKDTTKEQDAVPPKVTDMFGLRTPQHTIATQAAKEVLDVADIQVPTGEIDADGNAVTRSGREVMAEAEAGIAKAEADGKGYEAAVACILTKGFDNAA